jgi:hypothetical protein
MSPPDAGETTLPLEIVNGYTSSWERWFRPYFTVVLGLIVLPAPPFLGIVSGLLPLLIGALYLRRAIGPVRGTAHISPGEVRMGSFRVYARDVEAVTTGRVGSSVSIAVQQRGAPEPVILLAESEEAAASVLDALGAGETGAGRGVAFPLTGMFAEGFERFASLLSLGLAFMAGMLIFSAASSGAWRTLWPGAVFLLIAIMLHHVRFARGSVILERHNVRLPTGRQVQYAEIEDVSVERGAVLLSLTNGRYEAVHFPAITGAVKHFPHHLKAATARAHGPAVLRKDAPPLLTEAQESRKWLAELDAVATTGERRGYRDVTLDLADIEAVLADADRPLAIRAAAARVLLKSGAPAEKVVPVLEAFRGAHSTERARIVAGLETANDDEVAAALDALKSTA